MNSYVLSIVRQNIWASLTGGWYYDPLHGRFCNTVHLYLWLSLFVLPLLCAVCRPSAFWQRASFCYPCLIALLFSVLKLTTWYLHKVFDSHEAIEEEPCYTTASASASASDQSSSVVGNNNNTMVCQLEMHAIANIDSSVSASDKEQVSYVPIGLDFGSSSWQGNGKECSSTEDTANKPAASIKLEASTGAFYAKGTSIPSYIPPNLLPVGLPQRRTSSPLEYVRNRFSRAGCCMQIPRFINKAPA
ncbi:unnamed protein product [Soboliphyme baturini]|uniref:Pecanex-like protein n=1 Tax=Soboliphyme baturini TaxID=241478 RepID=A0A183ISZ9_9BILA|nr:unnamed protein product [Soboliphyme baturini]